MLFRSPGPYQGDSAGRFLPYAQKQLSVPTGRWVKFTALLVPSNDYTGRYAVWQDDTLLFDFKNVVTGYPHTGSVNGASNEWSVNNYASGFAEQGSASSFTNSIFVDDMSIHETYQPK